jgi:hypothetical protein
MLSKIQWDHTRPGKCLAAPAAPLPGTFSQNIFAGNFLNLASYTGILFKISKIILQVEIVFWRD